MFSNKAFDILKYVQRHLPDLATFYVIIAAACNLPYGNEVSKVINAIASLMAALLEISTVAYRNGGSTDVALNKEDYDE